MAFGMTLVCRVLMRMMAPTRRINIVTRAAMTTGFIGASPIRRSGVGSFREGVGVWSFMCGWMPEPRFGTRWERGRSPRMGALIRRAIRRGQGGT